MPTWTRLWKRGMMILYDFESQDTLQGTNISSSKVAGKMLFLFHRSDMLVPRRVVSLPFVALPKSNEVRLICFPDWLIFFSQKRKNLSMYKGHLPTWQALMHVKKLYAHCAPEQWPSHPRRSFGRELLEWREIPPYPATRKSRLKTDPINGQESGYQVGWQIIGHPNRLCCPSRVSSG